MIQQVNLYLPEFRKKKDWLNLANMARLSLAFVLLLGLLSGFQFWVVFQLGNEMDDKRVELSIEANRTNELVRSFGVQSEDEALVDDVRDLEEDLQDKRILLTFLEGREIGNSEGLSNYLADLARFHVAGLSLERVELRRGGDTVVLSGLVSRAENVPLFLQSLSQAQSYIGKNFQTVRIEKANQENEGLLVFDVSTVGSNPGSNQR